MVLSRPPNQLLTKSSEYIQYIRMVHRLQGANPSNLKSDACKCADSVEPGTCLHVSFPFASKTISILLDFLNVWFTSPTWLTGLKRFWKTIWSVQRDLKAPCEPRRSSNTSITAQGVGGSFKDREPILSIYCIYLSIYLPILSFLSILSILSVLSTLSILFILSILSILSTVSILSILSILSITICPIFRIYPIYPIYLFHLIYHICLFFLVYLI